VNGFLTKKTSALLKVLIAEIAKKAIGANTEINKIPCTYKKINGMRKGYTLAKRPKLPLPAVLATLGLEKSIIPVVAGNVEASRHQRRRGPIKDSRKNRIHPAPRQI